MAGVEDIKAAIEHLPDEDYRSFRNWFIERDHENWDKEIETDSKSGKLDFLVREAESDLSNRSLGES